MLASSRRLIRNKPSLMAPIVAVGGIKMKCGQRLVKPIEVGKSNEVERLSEESCACMRRRAVRMLIKYCCLEAVQIFISVPAKSPPLQLGDISLPSGEPSLEEGGSQRSGGKRGNEAKRAPKKNARIGYLSSSVCSRQRSALWRSNRLAYASRARYHRRSRNRRVCPSADDGVRRRRPCSIWARGVAAARAPMKQSAAQRQ